MNQTAYFAPYNDPSYGPGNMSGGVIYGDAREIQSAVGTAIKAGNDTILVQGDMSGGVIYGDAQTIDNSAGISADSVTCGSDYIQVGNMSGGTIYGDVATVTGPSTNINAGSNTITVLGNMSGGVIYGDAPSGVFSPSHSGYNTITVQGNMSGGEIHGGSGTDNISVGLTGGVVSGAMSGGTIDTGGGDDSITIGKLSGAGSTIECSSGVDNITIQSVDNGAEMTIKNFDNSEGDVLRLIGWTNVVEMQDPADSTHWTVTATDTSGNQATFNFIDVVSLTPASILV